MFGNAYSFIKQKLKEIKRMGKINRHLSEDGKKNSFSNLQCALNCVSKNKLESAFRLLGIVMKENSEISGHCIRVGLYAGYIAENYGMDKNRTLDIQIAGALHDIGKLGIPQHILGKTCELTTEEYTLIKRHPDYTHKILKRIESLKHLHEIALYHHERYDGLGYPTGLKGDQIPIESQIVSLADAFDAMTSDRSYRKALSLKETLRIILSESGKQFNPELVRISTEILPQIYNYI